jgi:hypothetical protein
LSTPVRHDEKSEAPRCSEQRMTPEISPSHFALRIFARVKYGITAAQVAGVYGVAGGAIERILRQT